MTNSQDKPAPPNRSPAPQGCDLAKSIRANVPAELQDADGQFLSRGLANFYGDDRPTFQPLDAATLGMLRSRGEILFLKETKESLRIHPPLLCEAPLGGQPLHFHLKLK